MVVAVALVLGTWRGTVAYEDNKPTEIPWVSSFDAALQLAKKQDKPIFLDFFNPK